MSRRLIEGYDLEAKDANFVVCLALYQHRRDTAIGLEHVTTRQKGLLWYYNTLRQGQVKEYLQAAARYGALREIERQVKKILKEARSKKTSLERRKELLLQALELQEQAKQWQT